MEFFAAINNAKRLTENKTKVNTFPRCFFTCSQQSTPNEPKPSKTSNDMTLVISSQKMETITNYLHSFQKKSPFRKLHSALKKKCKNFRWIDSNRLWLVHPMSGWAVGSFGEFQLHIGCIDYKPICNIFNESIFDCMCLKTCNNFPNRFSPICLQFAMGHFHSRNYLKLNYYSLHIFQWSDRQSNETDVV